MYPVAVYSSPQACRDRDGYWTAPLFNFRTCAACYAYLFPSSTTIINKHQWLVTLNNTAYPIYTHLTADVRNTSFTGFICSTITSGECSRWKRCCAAAESCCEKQMHHQMENTHVTQYNEHYQSTDSTEGGDGGEVNDRKWKVRRREDVGMCEETWDGFGCWSKTAAGKTVQQTCPRYVNVMVHSGKNT